MADKLNDFNLRLQYLLKDCHELISETIAEEIDLYSWDVEERKGMFNAIDEAMDIIKDEMPKFILKKERHLKLVPSVRSITKRND